MFYHDTTFLSFLLFSSYNNALFSLSSHPLFYFVFEKFKKKKSEEKNMKQSKNEKGKGRGEGGRKG